jgi:hypothetical protein
LIPHPLPAEPAVPNSLMARRGTEARRAAWIERLLAAGGQSHRSRHSKRNLRGFLHGFPM